MYIREEHNCKTTFVNGIHPMAGHPKVIAPIRRVRDPSKPSTRDIIVSYLERNPGSCAYTLSLYLQLTKSNCVEQLRKMITLGLVKRELSVNPRNGLSTYFYEVNPHDPSTSS